MDKPIDKTAMYGLMVAVEEFGKQAAATQKNAETAVAQLSTVVNQLQSLPQTANEAWRRAVAEEAERVAVALVHGFREPAKQLEAIARTVGYTAEWLHWGSVIGAFVGGIILGLAAALWYVGDRIEVAAHTAEQASQFAYASWAQTPEGKKKIAEQAKTAR